MTPYRMFSTRLVRRERLSHSFVRLTLSGDDLGKCSDVLLDQRVKLAFGAAHQLGALATSEDWFVDWRRLGDDAPTLRTYTLSAVRHHPDGSGEVDLDVVVHESTDDQAPGSSFALHAQPGDEVGLVASDRTRVGHDVAGVAWKGQHADEVLLIGDETALPAVTNIVATLPRHCRGCVLLEVPDASDVRNLALPPQMRVQWFVRDAGQHLARGGRADLSPDELVWHEGVAAGRHAWVAGETGWVNQLRPLVAGLGFSREQSSIMGYWKRTAQPV